LSGGQPAGLAAAPVAAPPRRGGAAILRLRSSQCEEGMGAIAVASAIWALATAQKESL